MRWGVHSAGEHRPTHNQTHRSQLQKLGLILQSRNERGYERKETDYAVKAVRWTLPLFRYKAGLLQWNSPNAPVEGVGSEIPGSYYGLPLGSLTLNLDLSGRYQWVKSKMPRASDTPYPKLRSLSRFGSSQCFRDQKISLSIILIARLFVALATCDWGLTTILPLDLKPTYGSSLGAFVPFLSFLMLYFHPTASSLAPLSFQP
ncbi:hypothetical protein E6C27_scaffold55G00540 [Cucumis melo var. makuwa]|uniref:Uncharacterized protein n=1 Tax=Cucumis melo var. makuwa TaxID=1194695 RepID=A0A5A7U7P5_CUCMM|nr:hypothetical protein E6C27_scaffold55G00540 [Cucumis melo var. makuwa]